MRILSLNVNDFGGSIPRASTSREQWDSIDKFPQAEAILNDIRGKNPDVVLLQEFEYGSRYTSEASHWFIDEMKAANYDFPGENIKPRRIIRPSMAEVFVRKELTYSGLPSPHSINDDSYWPRTCVIQARDLVICGTHTHVLDPDGRDYAGKVGHWDELIRFYHKHKDRPVLIIGDLNVYKDGTPSKEKFLELKAEGAIDAWTESGHPNDTVTHKISRIDYAMMSPSMYARMTDIDIDRTLWDRKMTDHAALIVDLADA